ncbi:MAG: hypothetical protein LPD71_12080 [Shewanella sp.]|nr:hypothetical protein [Shewanella sp.]MCF1430458.1 hypothetical protein [Shewanella sp.]MCF1439444.1 hypothetical protein [Shewanella sp.]MCF1456203.1 hypothetical protein [Shewanella sp.]
MRLRWIAGFVAINTLVLITLNIIRSETDKIAAAHYSLAAEVDRFSDKPDPVTVVTNDKQNTGAPLLVTKVSSGSQY